MSEAMLNFAKWTWRKGRSSAALGCHCRSTLGRRVALIGANGAGKSTLLMSIFGQPRIAGGQILAAGGHQPPLHALRGRRHRAGAARAAHLSDMSVEENLLMGNHHRRQPLSRKRICRACSSCFRASRSGATSGR